MCTLSHEGRYMLKWKKLVGFIAGDHKLKKHKNKQLPDLVSLFVLMICDN